MARPAWLVGSWNVGRDRAWGVPLPVWACDQCGHETCVAGLADLLALVGRPEAAQTGSGAGQLDPHRPAVDRPVFPCEQCGGMMRRVSPVLDVALEAAVLPGALSSEPPGGCGRRFEGQRAWLAGRSDRIAALLRGSLAWGRQWHCPKMWCRQTWICGSSARRCVALGCLYRHNPDQAEQGFMRPLWAWADGQMDSQGRGGVASLPQSELERVACDSRLQARLYQAVSTVTESLEACDLPRATRELTALAGDLSGPYGAYRADAGAIDMLSRLLAPFVPYLAEAIYQAGGQHGAIWPAGRLYSRDRFADL